MYRKIVAGMFISAALSLVACNQSTSQAPQNQNNTAATTHQIDLSAITVESGAMTSVTEGQYNAISSLVHSGKHLNEIVNVVNNGSKLVPSPSYTSAPSDGPCSSVSHGGPDGYLTSRSSNVVNTYTMSIKMNIPAMYTTYEGNVYADGSFIKTYYASSFAVPIPRSKSVELDALAQGPRAYAVGQLYCRT